MRKLVWMRSFVVLVMVALLPFAPPGGFGGGVVAGAEISLKDSDNGWMHIIGEDIDGYDVTIRWSVSYEEPYQLEARLYREPGEAEVPLVAGDILEEQWGGSLNRTLEPGQYRIELILLVDGYPEDWLEYAFEVIEVIEMKPIQIYVFGANGPIADLKLADWNDKEYFPISYNQVADKGYVVYTFEVLPGSCFNLASSTYSFSDVWGMCADERDEFFVHASNTDVLLQLYDFGFMEEDGELWGWVWFDTPGGYHFAAKIFDKEGNHEACELYSGEGPSGLICPLPGNPSHVQIIAVDGEEYPTNLVFRLDDVTLPGNFIVTDHDGRFGYVEQEIRFDGSGGNENEIALYRVIPAASSVYYGEGVRYIPADGSSPYSVGLRQFFFDYFGYPFHVIQLVDGNGHMFAKFAEVPVVDSMTDRKEPMDYSELGIPYYLDEAFEPGDKAFADTDKTAGGRAGSVEWSIPDHGVYNLTAYELYYADVEHEYIQGEALAYLPYELPEKFRHTLRDVPEEAEYLAVVPILEEDLGAGYYRSYYAQTFYVPLEDRVAARLEQLFVNGDKVLPKQHGSTSYEVVVPWDAEEADIKAVTGGGVVYFDDVFDSDGAITVELSDDTTVVKIRVDTPDTEWTEKYELTITKEPAPDAPRLTQLVVSNESLGVAVTYHELIVPYGTVSVPVVATAESGVRITLNGHEYVGTAEEDVPVTEDDFAFTIVVYDPDTTLTTEYTVRIRRMTSAALAGDVLSGRLVGDGDGFEYRFAAKGLTVGTLKARFVLDSGVSIEIRDSGGNPLADSLPVPSGAAVYLSRDAEFQVIRLRWLSDHLRSELGIGDSEPVTFAHIAHFVIRTRSDVTGDGVFDRQDVRLLLGEMD